MIKAIIIFFNLLLAALLAGTMFGIWIGHNPIDLSATAYVEQQQSMIRQLNVLMPLMGLMTIVITLISALLQKQRKLVLITLLIAAALLVVSGLITRFGNQPINEIIMSYDTSAPPETWFELREKWWSLHIVRTISALMALCMIIITSIKPN